MTATHSYIQDHPLSGREFVIDLGRAIDELLPIPEDRDRKGVALVKQQGLNIVLTALRAGAELSEHASRGIVVVQLLDGTAELRTTKGTEELRAGFIGVLDALEPHGLKAHEDCVLLITVSMLEEIGGDVSAHEASLEPRS